MCNIFKPQTSTVVDTKVLTGSQVDNIFRKAGVTCFKTRDDFYWVPDENTCISILKEAHASAPAYVSITAIQPGYDCDKFAHHFCDVAYLKKVNFVFEVWGSTPEGMHAWNVFITYEIKDGETVFVAFEAEPQNAEIWEIGTNPNYQIKTVIYAD